MLLGMNETTKARKVPRALTAKDVVFTLTAEYDDTPVRGNAMASGDDAADKACEDEIIARLDSGDVWAWAVVTVKAEWTSPTGQTWTGRDTLGACSYRDEEDFKQEGGYFAQMKDQALDDLNASIRRSWDAVSSLAVMQGE